MFKTIPVTQGTENTQIPIQATITDDFTIKSAILYYHKQGSPSWSSIQMQGSGSQFLAVIPSNAVVKGTLEYYIQVEDNGGNVAKSPVSGASNPYTVTVKEKGTGATNNTQSPNGFDPMLVTAISAIAILAVVVIVALLLIRKKGKRELATPYPTYYPEPWAYPQQGSTGYPDQSNYPNQQPQEVRTW